MKPVQHWIRDLKDLWDVRETSGVRTIGIILLMAAGIILLATI